METSQQLDRIENKLDDMASVTMRMSEATLDFSSSLLSDLKIKYVVQAVNEEAGEGQMEKYPWGEDKCEADGQPGCQTILQEEMLPLSVDGKAFGFYGVRSCPLPQLKARNRKLNGYPDLALGPEKSMKYALTHTKDLVLAYMDALVELKVARRDLKPG